MKLKDYDILPAGEVVKDVNQEYWVKPAQQTTCHHLTNLETGYTAHFSAVQLPKEVRR